MHKLQKLNIERIVATDTERDKLLSDGYVLVDNQVSNDLSELKYDELKALCIDKGIEFDSKIKKVDLIKLLEDAE